MIIVKNNVAFFSFYGMSTVWSQPYLLSRNTRARKAIAKLTSSIISRHLARASLKLSEGCSSCFWVAQEKYYVAAEKLVWSDTFVPHASKLSSLKAFCLLTCSPCWWKGQNRLFCLTFSVNKGLRGFHLGSAHSASEAAPWISWAHKVFSYLLCYPFASRKDEIEVLLTTLIHLGWLCP